MISRSKRLRELLQGPELVLVPGCGDALTASLIVREGFSAAYMSGSWTAGARGFPDNGLITLTEMVDNAHRIAASMAIPLIADADTGFGGAINTVRTVREFEAAGVAGIHLEDQELPKKCGLMTKKVIVPPDVMVEKLDAAVEARTDDDFVIIARTDAAESEGLDGALGRGKRYLETGVDLLFVEGVLSPVDIQTLSEAVDPKKLVVNQTPTAIGENLELDLLRDLGIRVLLFPLHAALAGVAAQVAMLRELRRVGNDSALGEAVVSIEEFFELTGDSDVVAYDRE